MQRFAVIGLGRFGMRLAKALAAEDAEVIAIDRDPKFVESCRDQVTLAVCLDSTDEEALRSQGVEKVDTAIVGIGTDFESAALTVALLRSMGCRRIVARAESDIQARIMYRVGADEIASPERESAARWAHRIGRPNLQKYVELGEGYSLVYLAAPASFHDCDLQSLKLRNKYGVNLVAINRPLEDDEAAEPGTVGLTRTLIPDADTTILPGDILIVVGADDCIARLPKQ